MTYCKVFVTFLWLSLTYVNKTSYSYTFNEKALARYVIRIIFAASKRQKG